MDRAQASDAWCRRFESAMVRQQKSLICLSDKLGFFELSVPLARNAKYASQVKRTSCVKCAFGTICGTLNLTAPKEQLHYATRHNFTAACRNFTIEIFASMWYNIGESAVHIISPFGAVYHHASACIFPAAWWDTTASRWWYTMLRIDDIPQ